jgi:serine/threonine-protein kinase
MTSNSQSDLWVGRFLGDKNRYKLERCLNTGGMGHVYLATDTKLGRTVAVKLLKASLVESHEMHERFNREVAVCAALNSEHIVEIMDHGTTPEGFPFYVMEYLEGQSLGQCLKREKRLPVQRSLEIIKQVCAGLQLAHEGVQVAGERVRVIHRDLKPDNIYLIPTALGELVKILDFGIAKKLHDSVGGGSSTNITHMFIGTYRYAAPEQLEVRQDIDERADIYSLGNILYRMISGTDPFGFGFSRQINEFAWVQAHTSRPPIPLRSQPGCEQISPQLEAVVMKCLQKQPRDRFASVRELRQALEALIAEAPTVVPPAQPVSLPTAEKPTTPAAQTPPSSQSVWKTMAQIATPEGEATATRRVPSSASAEAASETIDQLSPQRPSETLAQTPTTPASPGGEPTVARPIASPEPTIASTQSKMPDGTLGQPASPGGSELSKEGSTQPSVVADPTIPTSRPPAGQGYRKPQETIVQPPAGQGYRKPQETIVQPPAGQGYRKPQETIVQPPAGQGYRKPQETIVQPPAGQGYRKPQETIAQPAAGQGYRKPQETIVQPPAGQGYRKPQETIAQTPPAQGYRPPQETIAQTPPPSSAVQSRPALSREPEVPSRRPLKVWLIGGAIAASLVAIAGGVFAYIHWQSTQVLTDLKELRQKGFYSDCIAKAETVTQDAGVYLETQTILNACRLAYAKQLAQNGRYQDAISLAQRIPRTSPLYADAQENIKQWQEI